MVTIDSKFKNLVQRELLVFDFDDTLVDCNSDTWVHQLAPGKSIPEQIEYRHGQDYFRHVQSVLAYLHSQKVTEQDYQNCLSTMPSVPGMIEILISAISQQPNKYDIVILSDANSFFISSYLKAKRLDGIIKTVLTNPAKFSEDGQLITEEYHVQEYCPMSSRNLCKGEALKNYIGKRMLDNNTVYTCVNYVGDGENDLCPCSKLSSRDRIFARRGFPLDRLCTRLKKSTDCVVLDNIKLPPLKASVHSWDTGEDILKVIAANIGTTV